MKVHKHFALAAVIALAAVVSAGCASHPKYSGFCGKHYRKLQPGPEGGVAMRWLKRGVDFSKYNKLMLESVTFFYADTAEYKGIDPQALKELADKFNLALANTLKDSYPIVTEPGPDVLRVRIAITGISPSSPVISGITTATLVVPVGLAVNLVNRGVTGSWAGSGATTAELMALDSESDEVIAIAVDRRTADFTGRYSKWGSAEEAFQFWAGRMKLFLDKVHGVKE